MHNSFVVHGLSHDVSLAIVMPYEIVPCVVDTFFSAGSVILLKSGLLYMYSHFPPAHAV